MASFKDGEHVIFMMPEEHKRPNIIRGSTGGNKSTKICSTLPIQISEVPKAKSDNPPLTLENIVFTSADVPTSDSFASTFAVTDPTHVKIVRSATDYKQSLLSNTITNVDSEQHIQVVISGTGNEHELSSEQRQSQSEVLTEVSDEPIVQASLETENGNFLILMRGGEILSVLPDPTDSNDVQIQSTLNQNQDDTCIQSMEGNEKVAINCVENEVQNKSDNQENVISNLQSDNTNKEPLNAVTEINDSNACYVMVQLPNGTNALVPASALENSSIGNGQFVLNSSDELMQIISCEETDAQNFSTQYDETPSVCQIQIQPSKPSKSRKRANGELQSKGFTVPKKIHKPMKASKLIRMSGTQRTGAGVWNQPGFKALHPPCVTGSNSCGDLASDSKAVVADPKPVMLEDMIPAKPFRFDFPDDESNDKEPTNILSVVVEAFQKDAETRSEEVKSNFQNSFSESVLPPETSSTSTATMPSVKLETGKGLGFTLPSVQCSKCLFKASSRGDLIQHMTGVHNEKLPYPCVKCEKRFPFHFLLLDHYKIHNNVLERCNRCGQEFKGREAFSIHLKNCKIPDDFAVLQQEETTTQAFQTNTIKLKSASRRKTVYTLDKDLPCPNIACGKWFSDIFALLKHNITVHLSEAPFFCELCEEKTLFHCKEELLSHILCHQDGVISPYVCEICQNSFKLECHLNNHMRAHMLKETINNPKARKEELLRNPDKIIEVVKSSYRNKTASEKFATEVFCKICDDVYPNRAALDEHVIVSHKDSSTEQIVIPKKKIVNYTVTNEYIVHPNKPAAMQSGSIAITDKPDVVNSLITIPDNKFNQGDISKLESNLAKSTLKTQSNPSQVNASTTPAKSSTKVTIKRKSKPVKGNKEKPIIETGRHVLLSKDVDNATEVDLRQIPENKNDLKCFSSITSWRQNMPSTVMKSRERPDRNADDVRNDFKILYSKIKPVDQSKRNRNKRIKNIKQQVVVQQNHIPVSPRVENHVSGTETKEIKLNSKTNGNKVHSLQCGQTFEKDNEEHLQNSSVPKAETLISDQPKKAKNINTNMKNKTGKGKNSIHTLRSLRSRNAHTKICVNKINTQLNVQNESKSSKVSAIKLTKDTKGNTETTSLNKNKKVVKKQASPEQPSKLKHLRCKRETSQSCKK